MLGTVIHHTHTQRAQHSTAHTPVFVALVAADSAAAVAPSTDAGEYAGAQYLPFATPKTRVSASPPLPSQVGMTHPPHPSGYCHEYASPRCTLENDTGAGSTQETHQHLRLAGFTSTNHDPIVANKAVEHHGGKLNYSVPRGNALRNPSLSRRLFIPQRASFWPNPSPCLSRRLPGTSSTTAVKQQVNLALSSPRAKVNTVRDVLLAMLQAANIRLWCVT